jgi:hypothetical protein
MNLVLSLLLHFLKPFGIVVHHNVSSGAGEKLAQIGIIIAGIGVVILIALAVRYLVRLRNKNNKHD